MTNYASTLYEAFILDAKIKISNCFTIQVKRGFCVCRDFLSHRYMQLW